MFEPQRDERADRENEAGELGGNRPGRQHHPNRDAHEGIAQNAANECLLEAQVHFRLGNGCGDAAVSGLKQSASRHQYDQFYCF
jgi:hypothetical protein